MKIYSLVLAMVLSSTNALAGNPIGCEVANWELERSTAVYQTRLGAYFEELTELVDEDAAEALRAKKLVAQSYWSKDYYDEYWKQHTAEEFEPSTGRVVAIYTARVLCFGLGGAAVFFGGPINPIAPALFIAAAGFGIAGTADPNEVSEAYLGQSTNPEIKGYEIRVQLMKELGQEIEALKGQVFETKKTIEFGQSVSGIESVLEANLSEEALEALEDAEDYQVSSLNNRVKNLARATHDYLEKIELQAQACR